MPRIEQPPLKSRRPVRARRVKPDAEIVLLCNPRAGGRWAELAKILDSPEAEAARRIVTDSVEDVAPALRALGRDTKLICVYGGDGTIQRVLDRLSPSTRHHVHLALIGGGTMNVTSSWCGMSGSPADNFRHVVGAFRRGDLSFRELPLLEVRHHNQQYRGFTFGMGPIVRLLAAYENGKKGRPRALVTAAKAALAALTEFPAAAHQLLEPMPAQVTLDGDRLEYDTFFALFANVTGQINPGITPFVAERSRKTFHCAAYAVSAREIALVLPLLLRGWLPVHPTSLLQPASLVRGLVKALGDRSEMPSDPRYVNRPAHTLRISTAETLCTVDGELVQLTPNGDVSVALGPSIRLAVGPRG